MVKQISLDTWSTDRLNELLKKGTNIVTQTNLPIVLYRETLEEKEGSYDAYADLTERPAWITSAGEAWASDELKATLAEQIAGKKTLPLDTTAVWVEAE